MAEIAGTPLDLGEVEYFSRTWEYTVPSAGDTTAAAKLSDYVGVQLTGAATAVTAVVERSTKGPALTDNWAPVDTLSGNPAVGMPPQSYDEPGVAWWRVRLTALTGASVEVSISGKGV